MSTLLEMEPRLAGTDEVEPVVEFENAWKDRPDRTACPISIPMRTGLC